MECNASAQIYIVPLHDALPIWLGVERAIVFHAADGMDELSVATPSFVIEIDGQRKEYELDPAELGLEHAPVESMRGGGPRSEEHTSELQSRFDLVCLLLLAT